MVWGAPGAPPGPQDGLNLKKCRKSEFAGRPQGAKLGAKIRENSNMDAFVDVFVCVFFEVSIFIDF